MLAIILFISKKDMYQSWKIEQLGAAPDYWQCNPKSIGTALEAHWATVNDKRCCTLVKGSQCSKTCEQGEIMLCRHHSYFVVRSWAECRTWLAVSPPPEWTQATSFTDDASGSMELHLTLGNIQKTAAALRDVTLVHLQYVDLLQYLYALYFCGFLVGPFLNIELLQHLRTETIRSQLLLEAFGMLQFQQLLEGTWKDTRTSAVEHPSHQLLQEWMQNNIVRKVAQRERLPFVWHLGKLTRTCGQIKLNERRITRHLAVLRSMLNLQCTQQLMQQQQWSEIGPTLAEFLLWRMSSLSPSPNVLQVSLRRSPTDDVLQAVTIQIYAHFRQRRPNTSRMVPGYVTNALRDLRKKCTEFAVVTDDREIVEYTLTSSTSHEVLSLLLQLHLGQWNRFSTTHVLLVQEVVRRLQTTTVWIPHREMETVPGDSVYWQQQGLIFRDMVQVFVTDSETLPAALMPQGVEEPCPEKRPVAASSFVTQRATSPEKHTVAVSVGTVARKEAYGRSRPVTTIVPEHSKPMLPRRSSDTRGRPSHRSAPAITPSELLDNVKQYKLTRVFDVTCQIEWWQQLSEVAALSHSAVFEEFCFVLQEVPLTPVRLYTLGCCFLFLALRKGWTNSRSLIVTTESSVTLHRMLLDVIELYNNQDITVQEFLKRANSTLALRNTHHLSVQQFVDLLRRTVRDGEYLARDDCGLTFLQFDRLQELLQGTVDSGDWLHGFLPAESLPVNSTLNEVLFSLLGNPNAARGSVQVNRHCKRRNMFLFELWAMEAFVTGRVNVFVSGLFSWCLLTRMRQGHLLPALFAPDFYKETIMDEVEEIAAQVIDMDPEGMVYEWFVVQQRERPQGSLFLYRDMDFATLPQHVRCNQDAALFVPDQESMSTALGLLREAQQSELPCNQSTATAMAAMLLLPLVHVHRPYANPATFPVCTGEPIIPRDSNMVRLLGTDPIPGFAVIELQSRSKTKIELLVCVSDVVLGSPMAEQMGGQSKPLPQILRRIVESAEERHLRHIQNSVCSRCLDMCTNREAHKPTCTDVGLVQFEVVADVPEVDCSLVLRSLDTVQMESVACIEQQPTEAGWNGIFVQSGQSLPTSSISLCTVQHVVGSTLCFLQLLQDKVHHRKAKLMESIADVLLNYSNDPVCTLERSADWRNGLSAYARDGVLKLQQPTRNTHAIDVIGIRFPQSGPPAIRYLHSQVPVDDPQALRHPPCRYMCDCPVGESTIEMLWWLYVMCLQRSSDLVDELLEQHCNIFRVCLLGMQNVTLRQQSILFVAPLVVPMLRKLQLLPAEYSSIYLPPWLSSMRTKVSSCRYCGAREPLQACTCDQVHYCGQVCLLRDWHNHGAQHVLHSAGAWALASGGILSAQAFKDTLGVEREQFVSPLSVQRSNCRNVIVVSCNGVVWSSWVPTNRFYIDVASIRRRLSPSDGLIACVTSTGLPKKWYSDAVQLPANDEPHKQLVLMTVGTVHESSITTAESCFALRACLYEPVNVLSLPPATTLLQNFLERCAVPTDYLEVRQNVIRVVMSILLQANQDCGMYGSLVYMPDFCMACQDVDFYVGPVITPPTVWSALRDALYSEFSDLILHEMPGPFSSFNVSVSIRSATLSINCTVLENTRMQKSLVNALQTIWQQLKATHSPESVRGLLHVQRCITSRLLVTLPEVPRNGTLRGFRLFLLSCYWFSRVWPDQGELHLLHMLTEFVHWLVFGEGSECQLCVYLPSPQTCTFRLHMEPKTCDISGPVIQLFDEVGVPQPVVAVRYWVQVRENLQLFHTRLGEAFEDGRCCDPITHLFLLDREAVVPHDTFKKLCQLLFIPHDQFQHLPSHTHQWITTMTSTTREVLMSTAPTVPALPFYTYEQPALAPHVSVQVADNGDSVLVFDKFRLPMAVGPPTKRFAMLRACEVQSSLAWALLQPYLEHANFTVYHSVERLGQQPLRHCCLFTGVLVCNHRGKIVSMEHDSSSCEDLPAPREVISLSVTRPLEHVLWCLYQMETEDTVVAHISEAVALWVRRQVGQPADDFMNDLGQTRARVPENTVSTLPAFTMMRKRFAVSMWRELDVWKTGSVVMLLHRPLSNVFKTDDGHYDEHAEILIAYLCNQMHVIGDSRQPPKYPSGLVELRQLIFHETDLLDNLPKCDNGQCTTAFIFIANLCWAVRRISDAIHHFLSGKKIPAVVAAEHMLLSGTTLFFEVQQRCAFIVDRTPGDADVVALIEQLRERGWVETTQLDVRRLQAIPSVAIAQSDTNRYSARSSGESVSMLQVLLHSFPVYIHVFLYHPTISWASITNMQSAVTEIHKVLPNLCDCKIIATIVRNWYCQRTSQRMPLHSVLLHKREYK